MPTTPEEPRPSRRTQPAKARSTKGAAKRPRAGQASPKKAYHHGALRQALMEVGLALLNEGDVEELSMREIARRVGVSATAMYRHFPDKAALLAALAQQGLDQLGARQHAAAEAAGGGEAGFFATGRTYVEFALENPALFRLIVAHPISHVAMEKTDATPDAIAFLLQNAAALSPKGADERVYALRSLAVAHGLAMLMLDGHVPLDRAVIDSVIDVR